MENLIQQINAAYAEFQTESAKFLTGNKAAGTRARKATLNLDKLHKEFRKQSVAHSQK